ncbi:activator-dependent family glycosyltransferase [Streptomyces sp. NPDC020755]|uniref:activator-dependent family glycosyltransferase n=1 Tax=Streptomyces sp. NPDC020755 TaxID=3154790 RepID=UPI00340E5DD5
MKVLLTAFAMDAHFNGVVPLAWALRTAGHDVRVASQPSLTESITRAGLTAVPVGTDHQVESAMGAMAPGVFALHSNPDYLEHRPELLGLDFLEASTSMLTAAFYAQINNDSMIDELVDFARWWRPDLVVWEPFTFAGAVAAQVVGAAHARLLWGPDLFLRVHDRFRQALEDVPAELRDDSLKEWLTWTLERHGSAFRTEVVSGHWTIDQMPPSVRLPTTRPTVPMRFVPYNGPVPAVVPSWLRRAPQRQRVLLTQGITERSTGFAGLPGAAELLAAIAELDVEVVATVKAEEQPDLPPLPANVRVVDSLSLHVVLPTCTAVVHHGGAGTWATAALYGVPQLALAWQWDDVHRAGQLEKLGAGVFLSPRAEGASAGRVRDRLGQVLSEPSFRQGAGRIRTEMLRTPSPNAVVPRLERLTARHRTAAG